MPPKKEMFHADGDIKNLIAHLHQAGKTYSEIIHKLLQKEKIPISLHTIKIIGLQFQKTGSTARKKGSGRPRATTSKDQVTEILSSPRKKEKSVETVGGVQNC